MELKSFQRRVLEDLTFFLNNLQIESPELAFKKLWLERYGVDLEKETSLNLLDTNHKRAFPFQLV